MSIPASDQDEYRVALEASRPASEPVMVETAAARIAWGGETITLRRIAPAGTVATYYGPRYQLLVGEQPIGAPIVEGQAREAIRILANLVGLKITNQGGE